MPIKVAPESRSHLREVSRLWRALPRELKNDIRKWQRQEINPIWREEVAARPKNRLQEAVFRTGNTVSAGAYIELRAGSSNRVMRGGGTPRLLAGAAEFGTTRHDKFTRYNRKSKGGGTHTVTRRAARGIPRRQRQGYVAYPAAAQAIKRITRLAVQVTVRRIHDAAEGER